MAILRILTIVSLLLPAPVSVVIGRRNILCALSRPFPVFRLPSFTLSLFFIITASLPGTSRAATYYLDAAKGDDSNPGTSSAAWQTLEKAQSIVQAGDTLILRSGNYGEFQQSNVSYADWVTYKAENGHTPLFSVIRISNSAQQDAYLRFDGIKVQIPDLDPWPDPYDFPETGCANRVELINMTMKGVNKYLSYCGIRIGGSAYVTIDRCEITNVNRGMIIAGDYLTIKNSHIHHIVSSGIYTTGGNSYTIEGNHIHDGGYSLSDDYCPPYGLVDGSDTYTGSPAFQLGETIVQETTGAKATVIGVRQYSGGSQEYQGHYMVYIRDISANMEMGYQFTGQKSGATFTPTARFGDLLPHGSGIALYGPDNSSIGAIRNNIIHDGFPSWSVGCYKRGYHDIVFENNLIYDTSPVGFYYIHGPVVARNNTITSTVDRPKRDGLWDWEILNRYGDGGLIITIQAGHDGSDIEIYNNLITNNVCGLPSLSEYPNLKADYNYYWNGRKGTHTLQAVWGKLDDLHGNPNLWHDIGFRGSTPEYSYSRDGIKPFFVARPTGDFHLAGTSLAINAADLDNQPSDSLGSLGPDGFIRDDGPARDASHHSIGCYEYASSDSNNVAPLLDPIGDKLVSENSVLTFGVSGTDSDGDAWRLCRNVYCERWPGTGFRDDNYHRKQRKQTTCNYSNC